MRLEGWGLQIWHGYTAVDLNLQRSKCADGLSFLQSISVRSPVFFSWLSFPHLLLFDAVAAVCATAIQPAVLLLQLATRLAPHGAVGWMERVQHAGDNSSLSLSFAGLVPQRFLLLGEH